MKKLALALVAALPLAFASCGDDDKDLTLDQSALNLNYQAEATLKASESKCTWSSSNPFVASVDDKGNVKAEHVGVAVITATKDGATAKCNVTVNATNNNFEFPIMSWGSTVEAIKGAVSSSNFNLASSSADALVYSTKNAADGYPFYAYLFENNALYASQFTVTEAMDTQYDLEGWLEQYYKEAYFDNDMMAQIYMNANTAADATVSVAYGPDEDGDWYAIFVDQSDNTRSSSDIKAAVAKAKAVVKEAKN